MRGKFEDLTGQKFGRLTVIERVINKGKRTMWRCICDCPDKNICVVARSNLGRSTQSCGCLRKEKNAEMRLKHGFDRRKNQKSIYVTWAAMKDRCYNPHNSRYVGYGGRGIEVCGRWRDDFEAFYEDVSKLPHYGEKGYSLNRIDNDRNYELSNVEWATNKKQANNRRTNHTITYNGQTCTLAEWAEKLNMNYSTLNRRINKLNWTIEKALKTPVK